MVHIQSIVLTEGDHDDIERTGQGCIMNVIAYLQGERPTDRPQGVDEAFRTLAIFCNDHLNYARRQALLMPLVSRLMNTKTASFHELAWRMERLLMLEREVLGGEYPLVGFLEHMGRDLPQRIDCIVRQIVHATDRIQMHGRERELCEAIVRALDDMLPDNELSPKQRQDMDDLGAVAALGRAPYHEWQVTAEPEPIAQWAVKAVAEVLKPHTVTDAITAVWMDELKGEPA